MEERIKNRLMLLSILLVAGSLMVGAATALGTGKVFQGKPNVFSAEIINGYLLISEDGKVIQNLTLPKGKNVTFVTPNGGVLVGRLTQEGVERKQAASETELDMLFEIAKRNSSVQEIIAGKSYQLIGMGQTGKATAVLALEIEGKYYKVTIDLNSETVKSIEEQNSSIMEVSYEKKVQ